MAIDEIFPHLIVEGYGCAPRHLQDESRARWFLEAFPGRIGMTRITEPMVHRFESGGGGVSGIVIIAESHVSVHTFPETGRLSIDVFSCKAYDTDEAIRLLHGYYPMEAEAHHIIERGYGHFAPDRARAVMEHERCTTTRV